MTTIWDNIYKNNQNGGEAWASLSEGIHPLFKDFLKESKFEKYRALDIGCGNGKYLKLLQAVGFKTDGIDSSETAVYLTKKALSALSDIHCADMFNFEIPQRQYDLIISISTIHHGTKLQVKNLINRVYNAVNKEGKVFVTLPDIECIKSWNTFKDHKQIEPGTFVPLIGPEQGLPHSFFSEQEILKMFQNFREIRMEKDHIGRWIMRAIK